MRQKEKLTLGLEALSDFAGDATGAEARAFTFLNDN